MLNKSCRTLQFSHLWGKEFVRLLLALQSHIIKTRIIFWGMGPYRTGFPCWVSVLWTHLYHSTCWRCYERLCSASVNFFWRPFQHVWPFHDGWFTSAPAHTVLSVQQFLTKNGMTPVPQPPYSTDLNLSDFFLFPTMKKSSKGNILPMWKRWNKKRQKL